LNLSESEAEIKVSSISLGKESESREREKLRNTIIAETARAIPIRNPRNQEMGTCCSRYVHPTVATTVFIVESEFILLNEDLEYSISFF
jgi:hypothetical protein